MQLFRAGEHVVAGQDFEREHIMPEQEARYEADAWEENIRDYLDTKERVTDRRDRAASALSIETAQIGTADQRRIAAALESWAGDATTEGLGGQPMVEQDMIGAGH